MIRLLGVPKDKQFKFGQNAWFAVYYTWVLVLGLKLLWHVDWVWDFDKFLNPKIFPYEVAKDSETMYATTIFFYNVIVFSSVNTT